MKTLTKIHPIILSIVEAFAVGIIFIVSMILAFAYVPDLNEWLDKVLDKSDQQKTGIVLLFLFTLCFGTCLRLAAKK